MNFPLVQFPHPAQSLRPRMGGIFGLFCAVVVLALTGLLGELGRWETERQMRDHLARSASEIAMALDVSLSEQSRELGILSHLLMPREGGWPKDFARRVLDEYQRANHRYAGLALTDLDGTVRVTTTSTLEGKSLRGMPVFKDGLDGPYFGEVHDAVLFPKSLQRQAGRPFVVMDLSMPVTDEQGHPTGVLCAFVSWSWMVERYEELVLPFREGRQMEVLVLDKEGRVILAPKGTGLEGLNFSVSELKESRGGDRNFLYEAARSPGLLLNDAGPGWTVLVRQSPEVAFAPIHRLQRQLFLAGLGVALLAAVMGWFVTGIFTKPITQLATAARQIADGNTNASLPVIRRSDEMGALTGALRFLLETRERQAQEIRQSFRAFTIIFENAAIGISQVSLDGHWIRVNRKLAEITGYSAEELRTMRFQDITHPEDLEMDIDAADSLVEGVGSMYSMEKRYVRKDGRVVWVDLNVSLVRDDENRPDYFISIVSDITDRKRAERELRESEERFRSLIEHAADAILIADMEGVFCEANTAAERLIGCTREELIGKHMADVISPEDHPRLGPTHHWLLSHDGAQTAEWIMLRNDGSRIPVEISTRILPDGRWQAFLRDITERRIVEEELRKSKEGAEAANRAKDEFLAALSHELRTPLNPVLMLASEHEKATDLPSRLRGDFATIRKSIALEARLIDDLLDLTRITRGKLKIDARTVDAHEILHQAFNLVRTEIQAKQLVLTLDLSAPEHHISGDPVRLQQVFWNIIINAVKFTPAGGSITIRTRVGARRSLHVEVIDSGMGIGPDEMPRIFEAFSQGQHASCPHRFGGLGLGLSIARLLVELHSGRIWADSPGLGYGSSFHVEVPLTAAEASIQSPDLSPVAMSERGRRILLVEDHEATRTTLMRLLKLHGHEVQAADSLATARALMGTSEFDLVISDIGLPDGTGHELMAELRTTYGLTGIALSGYGMDEDLQRSKEAGFCAHLTKPVEMSALTEAISRAPISVPPVAAVA